MYQDFATYYILLFANVTVEVKKLSIAEAWNSLDPIIWNNITAYKVIDSIDS